MSKAKNKKQKKKTTKKTANYKRRLYLFPDLKNCFDLLIRDQHTVSITLVAKTSEEKSNWMASLVGLLTRSMLERMLDGYLSEEEKQQPLRYPPAELYR